jgi:hypothetical protein
MRRDVITLHSCSTTEVPTAGEVQVVGTLSANMTLADVFLKCMYE